jgi:hypothetical protein
VVCLPCPGCAADSGGVPSEDGERVHGDPGHAQDAGRREGEKEAVAGQLGAHGGQLFDVGRVDQRHAQPHQGDLVQGRGRPRVQGGRASSISPV